MLLKASDFIVHDLSAESVFEGCVDNNNDDDGSGGDGQGTRGGSGRARRAEGEAYKLELVLRKWFAIDPSRELRAFVRDGVLIGAFCRPCPRQKHMRVLILCVCAETDRHIAARCELL